MDQAFRSAAFMVRGRCCCSPRIRLTSVQPSRRPSSAHSPATPAPSLRARTLTTAAKRQDVFRTPTSRQPLNARSYSSDQFSYPTLPQMPPDEPTADEKPNPALKQLFNPFSRSPLPELRRRASFIKENSYCPHPDHKLARMSLVRDPKQLPEVGDMAPCHVDFECPDCGVPVYCSKEHWQDDYEAHLDICGTLREINEDDHDLRSGRKFPEFDYAGMGVLEANINLQNWDAYLYSREFRAIDDERSMRHASQLLTYPITVGSILHELSPYNLRNRMTPEGLKSMTALRYTLHQDPRGEGSDVKGLRPAAPPVRIFVLGARAESTLPREAWLQLAYIFPRSYLHLIMVGPESMKGRDHEFPLPKRTARNPFGAVVEDRLWYTMKISTIVDYWHTIHKTGYYQPFDPYFDCFVLFHPGLGHPGSSHEWEETLPMLLETKVPIICTGYTQYDMQRDIDWVNKTSKGEFDLLLQPGENLFRSLRWDLNDLDPQDVTCGNWGVWAFRGKRYETTHREEKDGE